MLLVIKKLAEEGRTMVMVTHEMSLSRDISSEVIFLHKGLVEERGAPQQMMRDPQSARLRQFLQMA
ncbi:Histidine transport ATP-binding protein HisP [compost metagenome]